MVLRYLIRNWLQNAAREKLREAVTQAAQKELAGDAATSEPPPAAEKEEVAHVGLVFALPIESGGLEDLLSGVITIRGHGFTARQGGYKGRGVVLFRSGAGRNAAARATETLIAGHKPKWILSAGFAGGLTESVKRFDVIMADRLVDAAGNRLSVDLRVDPQSLAKTPGVHVGGLLTVDQIVRFPDQKRALGEQHQALAVDMESFAVAEVCRREQVKFLAIRVISDPLEEELPPDVERLLRQNTRLSRLGAAVGAAWNRPGSVKDMWQLKENALVASDRLAKFLVATIEQLVPN